MKVTPDNHHAPWWTPHLVLVLVMLTILFVTFKLSGEIRDLRQRVTQLEQRR